MHCVTVWHVLGVLMQRRLLGVGITGSYELNDVGCWN